MLKGVLSLWTSVFIVCFTAFGETSHLPSTNRVRPLFGDQSGSGTSIDPCFPGRLNGGQVTLFDGVPPAQPVSPKESSSSKNEPPRPEPVDDQPYKNEKINERELPISFEDADHCRKELSKIEKKMRGNYGSLFHCELRNGKKVLARETSDNYCNSTRDGRAWTAKQCVDTKIKYLLEALSDHACQDERVIEKTTSIKCEYTDDMIYETIRFTPPEK